MKTTTPNPQPTSDTNYQSYVWPRSKNPNIQRIYDALHTRRWRYDASTATWWTPEGEPEAFGRLEHDAEAAVWARVVRPSTILDAVPVRGDIILTLNLQALLVELDG